MLTRHVSLIGVILFLLIASPCFAQTSRTLTPGLKRDRSALLALVNSMEKLGRSRMGAWKAKGNPCFPKPWPHISCKNGRVSAIDLANLDLIGTLPGELKRLNKLESMNMENNQLAGSIPEAWSDRQQFQGLRSINLANNLLSGSLPNAKWNRKNAFRSLEELNLAENRLTGGLPDGWLGGNKPFRKLKLLDLSDNQLGEGSTVTANWCLVKAGDDERGWCPAATPTPNNRLPILEILDLSHNSLAGSLPTMWPRMFPNLQSLLIHNNGLWSDTDVPAGLPVAWTRRTVPRAFPQLETLVLYPGNDNICFKPDGEGGFVDIFGDVTQVLSYVVEDETEVQYDAEYPWFCPGPTTDNPPRDARVTAGATVRIKWKAPTGGDASLVYGYRLSICKADPDTDECEPIHPYIGKVLALPAVAGDPDNGDFTKDGTVYTYKTTLPEASIGSYRTSVSTYNMDGVESTPVDATPLAPPTGITLAGTAAALTLTWYAPTPADPLITGYTYTVWKVNTGTGALIMTNILELTRADAPGATPMSITITSPAAPVVGDVYMARVQSTGVGLTSDRLESANYEVTA